MGAGPRRRSTSSLRLNQSAIVHWCARVEATSSGSFGSPPARATPIVSCPAHPRPAMSAMSTHRSLLVSAIVAVLALRVATDAVAQTPSERAAARRAARHAGADAGNQDAQPQQAAAEEYPAATRKQPGLSASARTGPQLNKVSEAQQAGDLAAAEAAAAGILDNDKANAYERAITLRLLADLLIGEDNERAKSYLREAIELDGLGNNEHFNTMLTLAQIQIQEDDYAGSLATLDRLIAETGTDKADV